MNSVPESVLLPTGKSQRAEYTGKTMSPARYWARRMLVLACVGSVGVLTSGCATQLGSIFGSSGGESASVAMPQAMPQERSLSMAASDAGSATNADPASNCPRISVWRDDAQLTVYEIGRVGDNLAIRHRGEITKTARECEFEPGQVTVKYGIAGRVLLGPLGQPGVIHLPVLVHVTDRSRQKIKTEKLDIKVQLAEGKPYGNFSSVRRLTFPIPEGVPAGEYSLFVTFDREAPGAG